MEGMCGSECASSARLLHVPWFGSEIGSGNWNARRKSKSKGPPSSQTDMVGNLFSRSVCPSHFLADVVNFAVRPGD